MIHIFKHLNTSYFLGCTLSSWYLIVLVNSSLFLQGAASKFSIKYSPFSSVAAPKFVPSIITFAPIKGVPLEASRTLPDKELFCPKRLEKHEIDKIRFKISVVVYIIFEFF